MPTKGWKIKTRTKHPNAVGASLAGTNACSAWPQAPQQPWRPQPRGWPDPEGRWCHIMVAQSCWWDPGIGCRGTMASGSRELNPSSSSAAEQLAQGHATLPARLRDNQQPAAGTNVPHTQHHGCFQAVTAPQTTSRERGPGPPPKATKLNSSFPATSIELNATATAAITHEGAAE